jgi:drug/metabolite transporter (DMT)-like permease
VIVLLALLAAFVFGGGVVLQQRAAMEVPVEFAARPTLLVRLFRRPLWMLGLVADVAGFGLQAAALRHGSLVVVQPLITTSLLFTLIFAAVWYHESISFSEWVSVVLVLIGLSVFLVVAAPNETSSSLDVATSTWLLCTGTVVVVMALSVLWGLRSSGPLRAGLLGLAAGVADAFMAVLAKAFAGSFDKGVASVFRSWTPYALAVGGILALLLISTAYQAGHPTTSLPIITVTDPLVGSLIGISVFGEHLMIGGVRSPLILVALAIMFAGLVNLSRNSRLASEVAGTGRSQSAQPAPPSPRAVNQA